MRSTEFEYHLQLVRDPESNDAGDVRLPEEQLLSWAFSEIGTRVQQISPSLEVEQRVMKAFDRELRGQRHSRNWPRYAAAIAAAVLFVTTVCFALLRHPSNAVPAGSAPPIELKLAVANVESQVTASSAGSPAKPKRHERGSQLARNKTRPAQAAEAPPEIATDFIRINAAPIEPGDQIVRVQLPRSAMAQFGLPVNMDRSDKPVKADVIVGIDGIAQAIRFVQ